LSIPYFNFRMSEEKTDNILDDVDEEVQEIDPREDPSKKNDKPTLDETVQKLIGKAGNHMESTLIGKHSSFEIDNHLFFDFSFLCWSCVGISYQELRGL
jgi:hypothetical protein